MTTGIYAFYAKSVHKRKITSDINHFMNTSCIIAYYSTQNGGLNPLLRGRTPFQESSPVRDEFLKEVRPRKRGFQPNILSACTSF